MPKKSKKSVNRIQLNTVVMARRHFLYPLAYIGSIIVFDMWNLIARDAIVQRWMAAGVLIVVNLVVWYLAKLQLPNNSWYKYLLFGLILFDVVFISNNIYWERGMASKAVAQFAIPLILAASLKSRSILMATATLVSTAYALSVVSYFFDNYGEGYRVELYGTVGFYIAFIFVVAWLLLYVVHPPKEKP